MFETTLPFVASLAQNYFPKSNMVDISQALFQRNDRKEGIIQDLRSIPDFPPELVGPTAGIVNFLELALDKTIHPYDGAAISAISTESVEAMTRLGEDVRSNTPIVIVIGKDRVVGRFLGEKESFVIDYSSHSEEPEIIYHLDNSVANSEALTNISRIDDSKIVLISL